VKIFVCFILFSFSLFSVGENILLKNASIFLASQGDALVSSDILISNGLILKIEKEISTKVDKVIDLDGLLVTPGLIAPYSHLGILELEMVPETRDDSSSVYTAGLSISSSFNPLSTLIPNNRRGGITSALSVPSSSGLFAGLASAYSLSGSLHQSLISEDIALFGAISSGTDSRSAKTLMLEDSFDAASRIINLDDWESVSGLPKDFFLSKRDIKSLQRVLSKEIPLVIKADRASDILYLLKFSESLDIRLIIRGAAEGWMVAGDIAKLKVPVILEPINNLPSSFDELGARLDNASKLYESGVPIMIASHEHATHNLHLSRQGAGVAVSYGLPWQEALKAMTSNVADSFGLEKIGYIKEGYSADLVVWNKDPLELSAYPEHIFISGKLISGQSRSTRLRDRYLKIN
jgi:imidazolonepropionase-like amidohydrolase